MEAFGVERPLLGLDFLGGALPAALAMAAMSTWLLCVKALSKPSVHALSALPLSSPGAPHKFCELSAFFALR